MNWRQMPIDPQLIRSKSNNIKGRMHMKCGCRFEWFVLPLWHSVPWSYTCTCLCLKCEVWRTMPSLKPFHLMWHALGLDSYVRHSNSFKSSQAFCQWCCWHGCVSNVCVCIVVSAFDPPFFILAGHNTISNENAIVPSQTEKSLFYYWFDFLFWVCWFFVRLFLLTFQSIRKKVCFVWLFGINMQRKQCENCTIDSNGTQQHNNNNNHK